MNEFADEMGDAGRWRAVRVEERGAELRVFLAPPTVCLDRLLCDHLSERLGWRVKVRPARGRLTLVPNLREL